MTPGQISTLVQLARCALTNTKVQADDANMAALWSIVAEAAKPAQPQEKTPDAPPAE